MRRTHTPPGFPRHVLVLAAATPLLANCGGSSKGPVPQPSPLPIPSACNAIGSTDSPVTSIVNGTGCSAAGSVVVILEIEDSSGTSLGDCSGTIVAPRAVLTAAHCLDTPASRMHVSFGTGTRYDAVSFKPSPAFASDPNTPIDVGIVLMGEDLPRRPVPLLLSRDARSGEEAVIAGWGLDQDKVGKRLRAGRTTISGVTDFLETEYGSAAGTCQGDSGGPLLVREGGGWTLAGVISGGSTSACNSGKNYYAIVRNAASFVLEMVPDVAQR